MLNPDFDAMEIIEADLDWEIDSDGEDVAVGIAYDYIVDGSNELAVFHGEKCVVIRQCVDMAHAEFIAEAIEIECIRDRARGETWRGKQPV